MSLRVDFTQAGEGAAKRGLAGYVRSAAPPIQRFVVAALLLPFWATSEIRQSALRGGGKIAALTAVWVMTLITVAGATGGSGPKPAAPAQAVASEAPIVTESPTLPPATPTPTPVVTKAPIVTRAPIVTHVPVVKKAPVLAVVPKPAPVVVVPPTQAPASHPACDPNYGPMCLKPNSPDYDCAGGSGNGPDYVQGPVQVHGDDHYRLDSDHDGVGCES